MSLHRDLISSATWHGRRVGNAIAHGDHATARYETNMYRYTSGQWGSMDEAEAYLYFDHARAAAIRAARPGLALFPPLNVPKEDA